MLQLPLKVQLDDSARLDNFISLDNQQLLDKLCSLNKNSGEFIYIWGAKETGKTHLAQALCQHLNQHKQLSAYLPFDNKELSPEILEGMAVMDLVCIDNLQAAIEEPSWQLALFNLYNGLKNDNKSLVIFGDTPPNQLTIELADLLSRLNAMEVYKLASLSEEQKFQIFCSRASQRGLDISTEVAKYIFSRQSRSMVDLIQLLEKLDQSSIALKRKITIPLVKQILG